MAPIERVRILVDSVGDLPRNLVDQYGITVVPSIIRIGTEAYHDGDLPLEEIFRRAKIEQVTTDTPDPEELRRAYLALGADGAKILSIHVGSVFSRNYEVACQLRRELAGRADIEVIDTQAVTLGLGLLALRAAMLAARGDSRGQIEAVLGDLIAKMNTLVVIDDLQTLIRSGRVDRGQAALGSLLGVKPVLSISTGGETRVIGKPRGWEGALAFMLATISRHLRSGADDIIGVVHTGHPRVVAEISTILERRFSPRKVIITECSAILGVHVGPGAMALCFLSELGRV